MVPPVPIPNTVVKHSEAESTWVETPWEDRKLPVSKASALCRCVFCVQKYFLWYKIRQAEVVFSLAKIGAGEFIEKKRTAA